MSKPKIIGELQALPINPRPVFDLQVTHLVAPSRFAVTTLSNCLKQIVYVRCRVWIDIRQPRKEFGRPVGAFEIRVGRRRLDDPHRKVFCSSSSLALPGQSFS